MSQSPVEQARTLRVGAVHFVSPNEIQVVLDVEAPEAVALNAGTLSPFPRIHNYLLVRVDDVFVVGQVEWITVEQSPFPKRRGMQDFGLVDLPYPLRRIRLNPLGTLRTRTDNRGYAFRRGSDSLPSVGSSVLVPTEHQLRAIVQSSEDGRVKIGSSPLASDAEISIDPDRLFGRHLAVLGNTGSGKSCSVAGLVRWSLESSSRRAKAAQRNDTTPGGQSTADSDFTPNARFIILDPNGEYAQAFGADGPMKARIFSAKPANDAEPLRIPLWLLNSAEWSSFALASERAQRPTLIQALRFAREGSAEPSEDSGWTMRRYLRTLVTILKIEQDSGTPWAAFPRPKSFYQKIEKWLTSLEASLGEWEGERQSSLQALTAILDDLCEPRRGEYPDWDFTRQDVQSIEEAASAAWHAFGGSVEDLTSADPDAPRPFDGDSFIRNIEAAAEMLNVSEYVETLLLRIRGLLADGRIGPILDSGGYDSLAAWLRDYFGDDGEHHGSVSIIDLSLVPPEIVHIVTAVIARLVFEALQRYVTLNESSLPTVIVMEEAHTFIGRYRDGPDSQDAAAVCCRVFERIAREGRKFGLGLVLSSQRPSELSPSALSQCNTFLLHRLTNDRDQDLVGRLVPDNLRGLLRELPSLPSQYAILLGWASELPVLVRMGDLAPEHQPRSDDPDIWDVWTGQVSREANWEAVAADWQQTVPDDNGE